MRATVYIETTIPSYLAARPSNVFTEQAMQGATKLWWDTKRGDFDLYSSEEVLREAARGDEGAAKRRLEFLDGIPLLPVLPAVRDLTRHLVSTGLIPAKVESDDLHLALAAVHGIDILLTWNCRHLANPVMQEKYREALRRFGYVLPGMASPQQLLNL